MGLLERVNAARAERTWPVGKGSVLPMDRFGGHDDSQFSPVEYGDYLVTSNEVFAAASLRARLMSGLDLRLFRGSGPTKTRVSAGPAVELLSHVNPFWTRNRLQRMDELAMCLWGESYWAVERDDRGIPREIWWMKPSQVTPVPHETRYLSGFLYEPLLGGQLIPFEPHEVIWFRYPNPLDEFSALAPMAAARLAADTASAMMTANKRLFDQGMHGAGVVTPANDKVTFSSTQAKELEADLARRLKGVDKAHRWAVLRYEAQFKSLDVTPKDAEFVNGLNLTLRQVCNAYGIPSPLLNDMEHATLANATAFERILWVHALKPDAEFKAAEICEQLLPRFPRGGSGTVDYAEFDFSAVASLQEAESAIWAREAQALDRGALTINEWRARKGLPEVPWGDKPFMPVNKAQLDDDNQLPAPAAGGTPPGDEVLDADGRGLHAFYSQLDALLTLGG